MTTLTSDQDLRSVVAVTRSSLPRDLSQFTFKKTRLTVFAGFVKFLTRRSFLFCRPRLEVRGVPLPV